MWDVGTKNRTTTESSHDNGQYPRLLGDEIYFISLFLFIYSVEVTAHNLLSSNSGFLTSKLVSGS